MRSRRNFECEKVYAIAHEENKSSSGNNLLNSNRTLSLKLFKKALVLWPENICAITLGVQFTVGGLIIENEFRSAVSKTECIYESRFDEFS